jgi:hypothetical protein
MIQVGLYAVSCLRYEIVCELRDGGPSEKEMSISEQLLLLRLGIEKVVYHRDNYGHAVYQCDVSRVG